MIQEAENLILKTQQYEFADGLRDIQLGLAFFLMGIFWYALPFNPSVIRFIFGLGVDKWTRMLAFLVLMALPILALAGVQSLMGWIRRRWLWRESGMVKPTRMSTPPRFSLLAGLVFILTIGMGLWLLPILQTGEFYIWSVILLASGWSMAVALTGVSLQIKIKRHMIIGIIGALASPAILLFQSSLPRAGLIFLTGWGLLFLASGVVVLVQAWPQIKEQSHVG